MCPRSATTERRPTSVLCYPHGPNEKKKQKLYIIRLSSNNLWLKKNMMTDATGKKGSPILDIMIHHSTEHLLCMTALYTIFLSYQGKIIGPAK